MPILKERELDQGNIKLDLRQYFTIPNVSNGFVAWLFGATGPLLIVLQAAEKGGLSADQISSWIFSIYGMAGILSVILSIYYRQPIAMAFSIPGAVLVGTALAQHSFEEVIGAYMVTGMLILVLGMSGIIHRMMMFLPVPIMMGMVSGVLLPFGIDIFRSVSENVWLNGIVLAVFLLILSMKSLATKFPPILGAIVAAVILLPMQGSVDRQELSVSLVKPLWFTPEFSLAAIGELVIPLALTVIAIQNAQGFGLMKELGYQPPVNALTNWTGITSIINGFFGGHSACIAGPMTAIIASEEGGPKEGRFAAGVMLGFFMILFGLFAPMAAVITQWIPSSLIKLLGGLAMLAVLMNSLQVSFSGRFKLGAITSFLITISGFQLLHIGAPFWGLVGGLLASWMVEREEFRKGTYR
ncbi:benzoate/H(+) symporter BenE family transporter [Ammoniphilus sp. YIM 78166]|uniref:benzoate/H(+) symporter BenE family transporter n=1 Tax=Ammoniphilus sp. YIM 78166 TaxID=1644106 RepID=UPI00106F26BC|nr:benzoate/H(+) symporter BenE family transporter [Ammoniphilus sp. YIM 78166]